MKNAFVIILTVLLGVWLPERSMAQPEEVGGVPIKDITKAFETPPDMLGATLQKVQSLQTGNQSITGNSGKVSDDGTFLADTFINPFIPQTPVSATNVPDTTVRVETPTATMPALMIPQFTLSGLVWNTKRPAAILNGKIVAIGDQVSSWSVTQITKEGVQVTFEDQNLWVKPVIDPNNPAQPNPNPRGRR